ncbi:MAG TPA: hypothetical protein VM487_02110 [Phycisphaerae bacterium]|nr:hypothetical protein [Phycisphaerae bacterium]
MQGQVRWYEPASRRGRLATGGGQSYPFTLPESADGLRGGDLVEFRLADAAGPGQVVEVRLRQRGLDSLTTTERKLVDRFLSEIPIER